MRPWDREEEQAPEVFRRWETQSSVIDRMTGTGRGRFVAGGANHPVGNVGGGTSLGGNKVNQLVLDV